VLFVVVLDMGKRCVVFVCTESGDGRKHDPMSELDISGLNRLEELRRRHWVLASRLDY
jgi:hypothetical protein